MTQNVGKVLCSQTTCVYREYAQYDYSNLYYYKPKLFGKSIDEEMMPFSYNIAEGRVHGEGTSVYSMYQFAAYMGIKEIYLIGMDCSYPSKITIVAQNKLHADFIPELLNGIAVGSRELIVIDHKSAKRYAEEHDIKIYNATRGGELEIFERVDFDNLF